MPTLTVDEKIYGELLAATRPAVISNDEEHASAMARISELFGKEDQATPEERELMRLLAVLIEDYERKRWPRKREKISSHEMLRFLMDENGLKQTDLADITPQANISAILSGRRPIGRETAIKLGKRFNVKPELFLDL
ncbi:MAG: helix-turn-helix domain-containing protein [Bryobacteraceae bacterium]